MSSIRTLTLSALILASAACASTQPQFAAHMTDAAVTPSAQARSDMELLNEKYSDWAKVVNDGGLTEREAYLARELAADCHRIYGFVQLYAKCADAGCSGISAARYDEILSQFTGLYQKMATEFAELHHKPSESGPVRRVVTGALNGVVASQLAEQADVTVGPCY